MLKSSPSDSEAAESGGGIFGLAFIFAISGGAAYVAAVAASWALGFDGRLPGNLKWVAILVGAVWSVRKFFAGLVEQQKRKDEFNRRLVAQWEADRPANEKFVAELQREIAMQEGTPAAPHTPPPPTIGLNAWAAADTVQAKQQEPPEGNSPPA
jgi:hypothetical protein